jgi:hypothetical protein
MERKYRQRGYMDKEWDDKKRDRRPPPERRGFMPEGPRGHRHAMNREAATVMRCAGCGRQMPGIAMVGMQDICAGCGAALHACGNCAFFDTSARFQCQKPVPAPIKSKVKANECELFSPRQVLDATGRRAQDSQPRDARAAFDDLFKK